LLFLLPQTPEHDALQWQALEAIQQPEAPRQYNNPSWMPCRGFALDRNPAVTQPQPTRNPAAQSAPLQSEKPIFRGEI
jgi:hypothetical protein